MALAEAVRKATEELVEREELVLKAAPEAKWGAQAALQSVLSNLGMVGKDPPNDQKDLPWVLADIQEAAKVARAGRRPSRTCAPR